MSAAGTAVIELVPDLDPVAFKRAIAQSLRQVADELDPPAVGTRNELVRVAAATVDPPERPEVKVAADSQLYQEALDAAEAQREYRKKQFTIERDADGRYVVVDHDEKLGYATGYNKPLAKRIRNELRENPTAAAETWYAEPLDSYQWEAV